MSISLRLCFVEHYKTCKKTVWPAIGKYSTPLRCSMGKLIEQPIKRDISQNYYVTSINLHQWNNLLQQTTDELNDSLFQMRNSNI